MSARKDSGSEDALFWSSTLNFQLFGIRSSFPIFIVFFMAGNGTTIWFHLKTQFYERGINNSPT